MIRSYYSLWLLSLSLLLLSHEALRGEPHEGETLAKVFAETIYPLLTQEATGESCVSCHDSNSTSELVFQGRAWEDFAMLLQGGYLRSTGPDSLLGRVTAEAVKRRMPKKQPAWPQEAIDTLKAFLAQLDRSGMQPASSADEHFPAALLAPFEGDVPAVMDNQFISYRQLRSKIETLFGHGWEKRGRDLFVENVTMFGGADFKDHFSESTRASSNFLTALDMMARDVVARAYAQGSGPFAQRESSWKRELDRLYHYFLYRPPTDTERGEARRLFEQLSDAASQLAKRDYELAFELTVHDPISGMEAKEEIRLPVSASPGGVYQAWIDQSMGDSQTLAAPIRLHPNEPGQRLTLFNERSIDNVSFAGVTLTPVDPMTNEEPVALKADAPAVNAVGAWQRKSKAGFLSFEDEGQNKGGSRIEVNLEVPRAGRYEVTLH